MKIIKILLTTCLLPAFGQAIAQRYSRLAYYVTAHQDDWQLFMGASVFRDITSFNQTDNAQNGTKVIIIHTTAGNLHDDDDTKSCDCKDSHDPDLKKIPYWVVREMGAKNSAHIAACQPGQWGAAIPYPKNEVVTINGHNLTRYSMKNVTIYFMRIKAVSFPTWRNNKTATIGTVDNSTVYNGWSDFVNTLCHIYGQEMTEERLYTAGFNFPEVDTNINPGDHDDHQLTGRGAGEAARLLAKAQNNCQPAAYFVGYHSKDLPINISAVDAQKEASLTAVYCLALADNNAWPEWGDYYQQLCNRNYYRTITTCDEPAGNAFAQDGFDTMRATVTMDEKQNVASVCFNQPIKYPVLVRAATPNGETIYEREITALNTSTIAVSTAGWPKGKHRMTVMTQGTMAVEAEININKKHYLKLPWNK